MAGYGQFCPIAAAAEVLTERWTPLVVRELVYGSRRFNDIQRGVPLMSSSLLSRRLRTLERAGVVERRDRPGGRGHEYRLTEAGEELAPIVWKLGEWGRRWAQGDVSGERPDVGLLMWWMHRAVNVPALPAERVVVHFRFRDAPEAQRHWWLVLARPDVDLCLADPGFGVDLTVRSEPRTMTSVFAGDRGLADALRRRDVRLEGPEHLVRAFPGWLGLSPFAGVEPARRPPAVRDEA